MSSRVLWEIDNEFDDRSFERLCTDLLCRWGYSRISPLGGNYDLARDAVVMTFGYKGEKHVIFQYSMEKRWEAKLQRELRRAKDHGHHVDEYVFVTSRSVTGRAKQHLTKTIGADFGWALEIFDREWLRLQLEIAHPDLAERYLRVPPAPTPVRLGFPGNLLLPDGPESVKALMKAHRFEEAIPVVKEALRQHESADLWGVLSWCYFSTYNYKEALHSINKALNEKPSSESLLSIHGCILAEDGAETGSRVKLLQAKDIFAALLSKGEEDWICQFNLANVLDQLADHVGAKEHYTRATQLNPTVAELWKNLGSCLHHLADYEEELRCFDRALELNPNLTEALSSKGITLCGVHKKYDEGLALINEAIKKGDGLIHWPHVHFWKAHFLLDNNQPQAALDAVRRGLRIAPDHSSLLELRARLLAALWKSDTALRAEAEEFFLFRVAANNDEFPSWLELAKIAHSTDRTNDALRYLSGALSAAIGLSLCDATLERVASTDDLFLLCEYIKTYLYLRASVSLDSYLPDDPPDSFAAVTGYTWVTFGIAFVRLHLAAHELATSPTELDLVSHFALAQRLVAHAVVSAGRAVAHTYREEAKAQKIEVMSRLVTLPYLVAQEEAVSQFVISIQRASVTELPIGFFEHHLNEEHLKEWTGGMLQDLLEVVNSILKLFPEGSASRK